MLQLDDFGTLVKIIGVKHIMLLLLNTMALIVILLLQEVGFLRNRSCIIICVPVIVVSRIIMYSMLRLARIWSLRLRLLRQLLLLRHNFVLLLPLLVLSSHFNPPLHHILPRGRQFSTLRRVRRGGWRLHRHGRGGGGFTSNSTPSASVTAADCR